MWRCKWHVLYGCSSFNNIKPWSDQRSICRREYNDIAKLLKEDRTNYFNNMCNEIIGT